jgi:hypothetical protein
MPKKTKVSTKKVRVSKRVKIILGMIAGVLVIGVGILGYLTYTGKLGLSASTKATESTKDYSSKNKSDPGRFMYFKVSVPRSTSKDGAGRINLVAGDEITYECKFQSTQKLYNPTVFMGLEDAANTNFSKTMTYKGIEVKRYTGQAGCWGADNNGKWQEKKEKSNNFGYGYGKPAVFWNLNGGWNYMNTGCPVTVKIKFKVKDANSLQKNGYGSGQIIKAGWAAGWVENGNWGVRMWSGDHRYGHSEVKVFYKGEPQPDDNSKLFLLN